MGAPEADDCWSTYAVHMRFRPEAAVDGRYVIRFEGGETFSLDVRDGALDAIRGEIGEPTLVRRGRAGAVPRAHRRAIDDAETAVAEGRVGFSPRLGDQLASSRGAALVRDVRGRVRRTLLRGGAVGPRRSACQVGTGRRQSPTGSAR